jgi:hypothetical protein
MLCLRTEIRCTGGEEWLFHVYNALSRAGFSCLPLGAPARWDIALPVGQPPVDNHIRYD